MASLIYNYTPFIEGCKVLSLNISTSVLYPLRNAEPAMPGSSIVASKVEPDPTPKQNENC
jgi:hypothetical protein